MIEAEQKIMETFHAGYVRKMERELKEMQEAVEKFQKEYDYGYYHRHELWEFWEAKRKFDERMHWFRWWAPAPKQSLAVTEYLHRWYATLYIELLKSGIIHEHDRIY